VQQSDLNIIIIFVLAIIIGILILVCYLVQNNELHKMLPEINKLLSKHLLGIIITGLIILGLLLVALNFHPLPQIVTFVEPKKIDATIPAGDLQAGAILIKNLGSYPENVNVSFNNESWINMQEEDFNFSIDSGQIRIINYHIQVPLNASVGNYTKIIQINNSNNDIAEIPVLINVLPPAQFQATIDAPEDINGTGYFKVELYIENVGDSPVYGVNLSLNTSPELYPDSEEEKNKTISLITIGANLSREWWINVTNLTVGWQTVQVNINSSNAGNQTVTTKINISQPFS
jgi:hypothetical protein